MPYVYKILLENYLPTIATTLGIFTLSFFVMYIHYRIRKKFYNKLIPKEEESLVKQKIQFEEHEKRLMAILYANNIPSEILVQQLVEHENGRNKHEWKINDHETDINYMKNYSFKRYIIDILNNKFPESYWGTKK
jgi:DNA polymerase elongation subunit (family B)